MKLFITLLLFMTLAGLSLAQAQEIPSEDYLPDRISPAELSDEFNIPEAETLWADGFFNMMTIEDWNQKNNLDLTQAFKVVILINKSELGSTAQTAKVYYQGKLYGTYLVSTGRETLELSPSGKVYHSITPQGWFRPLRFSPNHYSQTWQAPMPWAVFFNGGIALHATTKNHYKELGKRASGGCVRLHYDDAKDLYHLIEGAGKAFVPAFTQSGKIIRDEVGFPRYRYDYDTLIIVENNHHSMIEPQSTGADF